MENRLLQFINHKGLTSSKFADEIGVQRSSISHILSGRNKPSFDFLQRFMDRYPEVNPVWLMLGKETMYQSESNNITNVNSGNSPELFSDRDSDMQPEVEAEQKTKTQPASTPSASHTEDHAPVSLKTDGKPIEQIAVFYTDGTCKIYKQSL